MAQYTMAHQGVSTAVTWGHSRAPIAFCDAVVQTDADNTASDRQLRVSLCDATTQTVITDAVPISSLALDASILGNGGNALDASLLGSNGTDQSNDSSVITVINRSDDARTHDVDESQTFHNNDDDEDDCASSRHNEVANNFQGIHGREEFELTQDRDHTRSERTADDVTEDHLQDGAVMLPLLCPTGLECLLDTSQMVIHLGNLRHDIFIDVKNIRRMEVINEMRRVLFYIEQDQPTPLVDNSFLFRFYNREKQEVMQVYNPASHTCIACGLSWHWFKFCRFQAIVYSPPGTVAGFIKRKQTCFVQEFEILGPCEEVLLRLQGTPTDLKVFSVDLVHELGRLSVHGWVGVMHEIRRTANDYGLTFPIDLDVHVKALLLSSVVVIDWLYSAARHRR